MKKFTFLIQIFVFVCVFSVFGNRPKTPNVILILADDLGYNDLSCYRNFNSGQSETFPPTSQTPNIDKLAEQGIRFTDFYCGAAVCSPSRSALMTGRNATRVGIFNWVPENSPMHMRAREITIAELLKKKNYKTGHFGKWHLTSQGTDQPLPNNQGFDYSFYAYNNAVPSHHNPENYYRNGEPVGKLEGYACQLVVNEALQWLDKNNGNTTPFYIDVWFNEPHLKVAAPEELTKKHKYNAEYYGAIENMDIAVGRLMDYLKENNLIENTIIMFSSDNGSRWDHSNDPLRGEKCFNYEGGLREPFIVSWPPHVPKGKISQFNGSFTDILPTIASITDIPLPTDRKYDGIDISPVFFGEKDNVEREEPIFFYRYFHDPICMIRKGDWCLLGYQKLIPLAETLNESELANIRPWSFEKNHMEYLKNLVPTQFELYNLKDDVEQENNLAEKYPEVVKELKREMLLLRTEMVQEGGDWFAGN
ncbi:sulfatase-like hydrolase/transferase [Maribellus maritimus]|uniref:sulfatase-like hydrolase/transferase n=1 Tax=Maribellus maritimus TaxID=2870838 RepID=UPI001EEA86D1|nr:sulfatase-like hydrolase/transferase [Maribellus maritimus]MCG6187242.1 sulfatase-like hydrolase/transferase [Maribellus maritimus]